MFILSHTHHQTHLIWNEHTFTLTDNSGPVHCGTELGAGVTEQHACTVTTLALVLCCACRDVMDH